MNHSELADKLDEIVGEAAKLVIIRGQEYSDNEDSLRTFKIAAQVFGRCSGNGGACTPADIARMQLILKVCRLQNGVKDDSIYDAINYAGYIKVLTDERIRENSELLDAVDQDDPFDDCCCSDEDCCYGEDED